MIYEKYDTFDSDFRFFYCEEHKEEIEIHKDRLPKGEIEQGLLQSYCLGCKTEEWDDIADSYKIEEEEGIILDI